jgi:hypothetical protein
MEGERLRAVDVEVAVGGGGGGERAGDLGGKVLSAHRVEDLALAAKHDDDLALDVAGQRVGEVGGAEEGPGNA